MITEINIEGIGIIEVTDFNTLSNSYTTYTDVIPSIDWSIITNLDLDLLNKLKNMYKFNVNSNVFNFYNTFVKSVTYGYNSNSKSMHITFCSDYFIRLSKQEIRSYKLKKYFIKTQ
jgi:hypothetical protein